MSCSVKIVGFTVALLLGVRAGLPYAIERGIEYAGNRFLDGRVTVDDVDLGLLAGRFSLEGLRVDPRPDPAAGESAEARPPIATLARLAVNTAPSALLRGVLRVQEIDVEGGTVRLERSAEGDVVLPLNEEALAALRAPPEPVPPPDPNAPLFPLPVQIDRARFADLHALLYDPIDDAPSATFDLAHTELADLRLEGQQARLGRIAVVEPSLLVDRGLVTGPRALLREEEGASPEEATVEVDVAAPPPATAAAEATPPASDAPAAAAAGGGAGVDVDLAEVAIEDAGITWVDRTFDPVVREESKRFSLVANDLVLSQQGFSNLEIHGQGLRGEPFELSGGALEEGGLGIHLVAHEVDLTPFGRYAAELAGYGVEQGRVSIDTRVRADLPHIETRNEVVLHQLRLNGTGYLESSLGIGANLAIALLSGPDGEIRLELPVDIDPEQTEDSLASARQSVQEAIERSLGDVGDLGTDGEGLSFQPLASSPGQAALVTGQVERLASLAGLLHEKPAVAVVLSGRTGEADSAPLAQQLGTAPEALSEEQIAALARQRAEAVGQALAKRGVPAAQVRIGDASPPGTPGVLLALALASD